MTFRKCDLTHLNELTAISHDTFVAAFGKDNKPDDFKTYIDAAFNEKQIRSELMDPKSEFYFVKVNGVMAGYFKLNEHEAQAEPFGKDSLELSRIYILNDFKGQGLGTECLNKIISIGRKKKKFWLWLGVWQLNVQAVRFYERHGFVKFDTHAFYIGKDRQTDWLMRLDLI